MTTVTVTQEAARNAFRNLLSERGCSEAAVDALWKWYDFTDKKGVASF